MSNGTKYYLMKRCLQCFKVNDPSFSRCSQCGYLFTSPATKEEVTEANKKLMKLSETAEEDKKWKIDVKCVVEK